MPGTPIESTDRSTRAALASPINPPPPDEPVEVIVIGPTADAVVSKTMD